MASKGGKAAPKPQTFQCPDGKEFSTKAEWRTYMMATFYSFKDKKDAGVLIKNPGEVDGQVFDIAQCSGSTLVVLDKSEAVQIDNLTNCRVFIGCCVSSIYIRNCESCLFYTCCRQLRLREVKNSTLYVYSQAEVHIELSTGLAFAPFNGGYLEQSHHFEQARMDASKNLWYDIFDHNDPAKTRVNWRLLEPKEMEPAWFPQGTACTPCVPVTVAGFVQNLEAGKDGNQIGQAFGVEQMMADAERIKSEAISSAADKLNMEVALLVASAIGKGINVSVWLTEGGGVDGKSSSPEFNAKLTSLSLVVGVEEDMETKRELEQAIGKSSLQNIAEVCGKGKDKKSGAVMIDVAFFMAVAQAKVSRYLEQADQDVLPPVEAAPKSPARTSASPPTPPSSQQSAMPTPPRVDKEQLDTVLAAPEEVATRLQSDNRSQRLIPSSPLVSQLADATETIIPDSPYDEEVAFDLEEDEEAETVLPYGAKKSTAPRSFAKRPQSARGSSRMSSSPARAPHAQAKIHSSASKNNTSPLQAPRPSSAGPTRSPSSSSKLSRPAVSASQGTGGIARMLSSSTPAASTQRSLSAGASRASNASSVLRSSLSATATRPLNSQEEAERRTRYAIRHTDLYHLVQVHLGFIDAPYRLVPPRGPIVTSIPRPWLTIRDLKNAFGAARENFSDTGLSSLLQNVVAFAKSKSADVAQSEVVIEEGNGLLVASSWLKQYLVHLRLTKSAATSENVIKDACTTEAALPRAGGGVGSPAAIPGSHGRDGPLEWKDWLSTKLVDDEQAKSFKPKEFRRALAGRKHGLSKDEMNNMLEGHEIIPADNLKVEISQQVRSWILDMDGRMDFSHSLNLERRRYLKDHSLVSWKQLSADQRIEVERGLRKKLASSKSAALLASEKTSAAVTKALFAKFERFNKLQGYDPMVVAPWGTWLAKHQATTEDGIQKFKIQSVEREKAIQQKRTRSRTVAPLVDVETQLLKAAEALLPDHNIELRKSLVKLRRTVMGGRGGTPIVSKQDFEKHLDRVLAPRLQDLPEALRPLAAEARHSHEGLPPKPPQGEPAAALVDALFRADQEEALARVQAIESEREQKKKADFEDWNTRKEAEKAAAAEDKRKQQEAKNAAKEKKAKQAQKAFRTWVRLRKDGKYATSVPVDGTRTKKIVRQVPELRRVSHNVHWNKEAELPGYTYR